MSEIQTAKLEFPTFPGISPRLREIFGQSTAFLLVVYAVRFAETHAFANEHPIVEVSDNAMLDFCAPRTSLSNSQRRNRISWVAEPPNATT